ncbi:MAG: methyl-accepting chemotaxis protein, partial [Campylobacteraceae bacterium]|nr:methyl-accepting chemotaxis protein [Campylobacteraceae bacterium]
DEVYSHLGQFESKEVVPNKNMENWISTYLQTNTNINQDTINALRNSNIVFTEKLQELINANAKKESNLVLNSKAKEVEEESLKIFTLLNNLKKDACKR